MQVRLAVFVVGASLLTLAACGGSSSSGSVASPASGGNTAAGATSAANTGTGGTSKSIAGCSLLTPAELSQAVGVTYTQIDSVNSGSLCNVTGAAPTDSFSYSVTKEDGALTTWDSQVATVKEDDGSATDVSGIGDRAVQGAVKEFAAETKGYIVVVIGADVNNQTTAKDFTHTKAVEQALISKI